MGLARAGGGVGGEGGGEGGRQLAAAAAAADSAHATRVPGRPGRSAPSGTCSRPGSSPSLVCRGGGPARLSVPQREAEGPPPWRRRSPPARTARRGRGGASERAARGGEGGRREGAGSAASGCPGPHSRRSSSAESDDESCRGHTAPGPAGPGERSPEGGGGVVQGAAGGGGGRPCVAPRTGAADPRSGPPSAVPGVTWFVFSTLREPFLFFAPRAGPWVAAQVPAAGLTPGTPWATVAELAGSGRPAASLRMDK
jgi:hypothetical protein